VHANIDATAKVIGLSSRYSHRRSSALTVHLTASVVDERKTKLTRYIGLVATKLIFQLAVKELLDFISRHSSLCRH
jgi:hypothetical protein